MYYAMGHFSKFLSRNSIRIDTIVLNEEKNFSLEPLKVVCFKTPTNQIVIVALNYDPTHVQSVQIQDPNHGYLTLTLLPESIQTIVYNIGTTV
jgi:O-glycosyl hydrolase